MKNWRRAMRYLLAFCITGVFNQTNCIAHLYPWTNSAGGAFNIPGNWSPVCIPTITGQPLINLNSACTVSFANSQRTSA